MTLTIADRLEITDLLTRADNAATSRDVAGYVHLFSEDAVLDGDKGEHRGWPALTKTVGPVWASEPTGSVHLTLNLVIADDPEHSDRAVATSTLLILEPGPPPTIVTISSITQQVTRTPRGWLIARRTVGRP